MSGYNGPDRRDYSRADLDKVARQAAETTARETVPRVINDTLTSMGIDTHDPIALQRQMEHLREDTARWKDPEWMRDQAWTRANRERCEQFYKTIAQNLIRVLVLGVVGLLIAGVGVWIKGFVL